LKSVGGCRYKGHVGTLMTDCFGSAKNSPKFLQTYMNDVYKLGYTDAPQYSKLRGIIQNHLSGRDATRTLEWITQVSRMPGCAALVLTCTLLFRPLQITSHLLPRNLAKRSECE